MPEVLNNVLTATAVNHAKPGRHGDGGGLFLLVKPTGMRSWVSHYQFGGKVRDMGLGSAAGSGAVPLAEARRRVVDLLRTIRSGIDPLADRERRAAETAAKAELAKLQAITFKAVASAFITANEAGIRPETRISRSDDENGPSSGSGG